MVTAVLFTLSRVAYLQHGSVLKNDTTSPHAWRRTDGTVENRVLGKERLKRWVFRRLFVNSPHLQPGDSSSFIEYTDKFGDAMELNKTNADR